MSHRQIPVAGYSVLVVDWGRAWFTNQKAVFAVAFQYRSAFVHEFVDSKVLMGGGLNPLPGATDALNKWAAEGYEPYTIQYDHSDDYHVTTYITFRKGV